MDTEIITSAETLTSISADITLFGLFFEAGLVVQIVILLLLAASIRSWGIIIEKLLTTRLAKKNAIKFYRDFWSSDKQDIYETYRRAKNNPMAKVFESGYREWENTYKIHEGMPVQGVQSRVQKAMNVQINIEIDKLENRLLFLASVGSAAPFVGLFGTVMGIMNSFMAIASSKNTNLTVVAPGIAEALFATAIGLFAAIPAVMFYNKISNDISRLVSNLENFSDEFINYLSRHLDAQLSKPSNRNEYPENEDHDQEEAER
jgi:biopolymer transport protein TolQ|tara:strand:+ start:53199 stop:53981 length:783 start_codon:yes stop_codon:yes gene_type:complete